MYLTCILSDIPKSNIILLIFNSQNEDIPKSNMILLISDSQDELVRIKSNKGATIADGYFTAEDARRTVNLLRMSLTCTTAMPSIKDDSDEEMEIDENDVERPSKTSKESLHSASTGEPTGPVLSSGSMEGKSLSAVKLSITPVISELSPSESQSRKSPRTSSSISPSHRAIEESTEAATSAVDVPLVPNRKAESLAASIHRGLQVFDNDPKKNNKAIRRASFSFFVRPISPEPPLSMESAPVSAPLQVRPVCVDAGTQTIPEELEEVMKDDSSVSASGDDILATNHDPSLELVPLDAPLQTEKSKKQKVPKVRLNMIGVYVAIVMLVYLFLGANYFVVNCTGCEEAFSWIN